MSAHNKLQKNGVCWDCGTTGAISEIIISDGVVKSIGWRCANQECARWWPVKGDDLANWVSSINRKLKSDLLNKNITKDISSLKDMIEDAVELASRFVDDVPDVAVGVDILIRLIDTVERLTFDTAPIEDRLSSVEQRIEQIECSLAEDAMP